MNNTAIYPFAVALSLGAFYLSSAPVVAGEEAAHAQQATERSLTATMWLDNRYCVTTQQDATYYLADYSDTEGGFAVTLHYADTNSRRLEANIRNLSFCDVKYFGEYRSYFRTGELLEQGEFDEDGLRQGWVEVFDRDGEYVRRIPYVNDMVHGTYTTYHEGNVLRVEEVAEGERHGSNKLYFANDNLRRDVNYQNGQRHGQLREWDPDGNLIHVADYYEGQLHGKRERFFESGELRSTAEYEHGTTMGEHLDYSAPGKLSSKRIFDQDGQRIAERRYDGNGDLNYAQEPTDTPHGPGRETRHYQPAGKLSSVNIVDDEQNWQLRKSFDENGEVTERTERLHGRRIGDFVRRGWGRDLQYGTYKDDNLHGRYYTTNDDGEVMTEGEYDRGVKIGRWVERTDYHTIIEHYNDDGELDGMREEYDANGKLLERAHYADGTLHGHFLKYSGEQVVADGEFVDGKREGDWIISLYYSGGATQHGRYDNDKQVGLWKIYDHHGHRTGIQQFNGDGERHGRQLEFESNGALRMLQEYQDGVEHGIRVYYHYGEAYGKARYEDGYHVEDLDDEDVW